MCHSTAFCPHPHSARRDILFLFYKRGNHVLEGQFTKNPSPGLPDPKTLLFRANAFYMHTPDAGS